MIILAIEKRNAFKGSIPHGTRTCIKRKKIIYGKFFDFWAEKCV